MLLRDNSLLCVILSPAQWGEGPRRCVPPRAGAQALSRGCEPEEPADSNYRERSSGSFVAGILRMTPPLGTFISPGNNALLGIIQQKGGHAGGLAFSNQVTVVWVEPPPAPVCCSRRCCSRPSPPPQAALEFWERQPNSEPASGMTGSAQPRLHNQPCDKEFRPAAVPLAENDVVCQAAAPCVHSSRRRQISPCCSARPSS